MKLLSTRKNAIARTLLLCLALLGLTEMATARNSILLRQEEGEVADPVEEVEEEKPKLELYFDYTNAFLAGFKSQETLPSAQNCSRYLEQSLMLYKSSRESWSNDTVTEDWDNQDYLFNTTKWISYSLAPASGYCVMSVLEGYKWGLLKDEQFDSFGDVFAAWLQNLLGNVITFNSIYDKIEEANEAENDLEVYFWYGRFATLFINFEPIEEDNFDDIDFDDDEDDFQFDDLHAMPNFLKGVQHGIQRLSATNRGERQGPQVGGFFANTWGFTSGFINASLGDASPNSTICETNITRAVNQSVNFIDYVKDASADSLELAAVAFEDVLASVHPIAFSCLMSVDEFGVAADAYWATATDFNKISYNLIHKLGFIYDSIFYLLKHQQNYGSVAEDNEAGRANWWFKLGIYYGHVLFLIFYSDMEIDPYDPLEDYEGLSDGAITADGTDLPPIDEPVTDEAEDQPEEVAE